MGCRRSGRPGRSCRMVQGLGRRGRGHRDRSRRVLERRRVDCRQAARRRRPARWGGPVRAGVVWINRTGMMGMVSGWSHVASLPTSRFCYAPSLPPLPARLGPQRRIVVAAHLDEGSVLCVCDLGLSRSSTRPDRPRAASSTYNSFCPLPNPTTHGNIWLESDNSDGIKPLVTFRNRQFEETDNVIIFSFR